MAKTIAENVGTRVLTKTLGILADVIIVVWTIILFSLEQTGDNDIALGLLLVFSVLFFFLYYFLELSAWWRLSLVAVLFSTIIALSGYISPTQGDGYFFIVLKLFQASIISGFSYTDYARGPTGASMLEMF